MKREVLLNTTERIYLRIYVGGTLTDSDVTPTVTVWEKGEIIHATTNATHEGTGVYYVPSSLVDAEVEKDVEYRWSFSVNGTETTKTEKISFVTPYLSLQEIREIDSTITDYSRLIAAEQFARFMINQFCGQDFGKRRKTINVHGNDRDRLILPERLVSVDYITENGVPVFDINDVPDSYVLNISDTSFGLELSNWSEYGVVISLPTDTGRTFSRNASYSITGVWGWDDVPAEVGHAAHLLAEDFLCRRDLAWQAKWASDVSGKDWKFSFDKRQFDGTGNSYADRILSPFTMDRAWGVLV